MISKIFTKYFRKPKSISEKIFTPIPSDILNVFNRERPRNSTKNLCNAPFRNMYFDPEGNVYVCCYNQKHPLGKYPDSNLRDIWKSASAEKLRTYIRNKDLTYGCDECRSALLEKQFSSAHIPFYDSYFGISGNPTMLELQISNNCNLECSMCSEDLSSSISAKRGGYNNKFNNPYDAEFIKQLEDFIPGLQSVLFTGGEPFIISTYFDLWERFIQKNPNCKLTIQTNGTILNERIKSLLERGNFHIGISLDSLNADTYKTIRVNASLQETLKNIDYFSEYCHKNKRYIGISFCPMQQNWGEIPDIINFCNKKDIELHFNTVWFPGKNAIWVLDSFQIDSIIKEISSSNFETATLVQKKNIVKFQNLIRTFTRWSKCASKYSTLEPSYINPESIRNMEDGILERISRSFESNDIQKTGSQRLVPKNILDTIKRILEEIPDNELKLKSLQVISSFRDNKILSNIFRENEEGLRLLIKNIYRLPEIR